MPLKISLEVAKMFAGVMACGCEDPFYYEGMVDNANQAFEIEGGGEFVEVGEEGGSYTHSIEVKVP